MEQQQKDDVADPPSSARIKVWDLPTRVFHGLLAVSFAGAWLSADTENWQGVHRLFGYTMAGLLVFRLVWGVVGTRHARFASFIYAPSRLIAYLSSLKDARPQHFAGHNPAGALAIFALLGLGLFTVLSGIGSDLNGEGEMLGELHEGLAVAMLVVVIVHLIGVVVSSRLHRENLARAMIDGYKEGDPREGITRTRPWVAALLVVAVLGLWTGERAGWIALNAPERGAAEGGGGRADGGHDRHRDERDDD